MSWPGKGTTLCEHGDEDGKCNFCYDIYYLPNLHREQRKKILVSIEDPILRKQVEESWVNVRNDLISGFLEHFWRIGCSFVLRKGGAEEPAFLMLERCQSYMRQKLGGDL